MGSGYLAGGAEYIAAAFAVVWTGLLAYGISLAVRLRRTKGDQ
jgi:CcmD family protein